jgi:hypothetical protein
MDFHTIRHQGILLQFVELFWFWINQIKMTMTSNEYLQAFLLSSPVKLAKHSQFSLILAGFDNKSLIKNRLTDF